MSISVIVLVVWGVFWAYWLIAAVSATPGTRSFRARAPGLLILVVFVVLRALKVTNLDVHSLPLQVVGLVLLGLGLGEAVWARIYLGRNWGMPMTRKQSPELVTSGPYRFVRHPIYSGLLLALLGSALAANLLWLVALAVAGAYFIYSAREEERILTAAFPEAYPAYQARSKMLIPFLL
ncbi:MAG: isoprenylcysteine carboxylmethyltransferase family protein [Solirubrobacterales bacterium]|nr:isoprenylcysteine carboxylmethyltransferase family protein [Solirubrobacterales bacterium]